MKLLTEEQLDRYEAFRRSSLARRNMKRVRHLTRAAADVLPGTCFRHKPQSFNYLCDL